MKVPRSKHGRIRALPPARPYIDSSSRMCIHARTESYFIHSSRLQLLLVAAGCRPSPSTAAQEPPSNAPHQSSHPGNHFALLKPETQITSGSDDDACDIQVPPCAPVDHAHVPCVSIRSTGHCVWCRKVKSTSGPARMYLDDTFPICVFLCASLVGLDGC